MLPCGHFRSAGCASKPPLTQSPHCSNQNAVPHGSLIGSAVRASLPTRGSAPLPQSSICWYYAIGSAHACPYLFGRPVAF
eukprot:2455408-Pyramimonas_sp.AAC.1